MKPKFPALWRLARPRQWVKNGFVVAPLFFTPEAVSLANLGRVGLAVAVFCLLASAIYIFNDWFDAEADRLHPGKCGRPIAAGEIAPGTALLAAGLLIAAGLALSAAALPRLATGIAAGYVAMSLAYSARLKHVAILDVLIIATGFVLRIEFGGAAAGIPLTVWIVVCTFLLALFMALAKRRDDLAKALDDAHRPALAGYNLPFVDTALGVVLAALLVSYLIYTTEPGVIARLHTDKLYFTAPFVVAGVLRYLQIALVEKRSGSPTDLALTDRFLILAILGWLAVFAALLYG